jgi:hypothetical protein
MDIEKEINSPTQPISALFEENTLSLHPSKISLSGMAIILLKMASYINGKYSLRRKVVARGIGSGMYVI